MFLKVGLRDIWKDFREEVVLELKLKFQAEQNQTVDPLVKSGFWLQMIFYISSSFNFQPVLHDRALGFHTCSDYCSFFFPVS